MYKYTNKELIETVKYSGYTQRHIAKELNINYTHLSLIICGKRPVSRKMRGLFEKFIQESVK